MASQQIKKTADKQDKMIWILASKAPHYLKGFGGTNSTDKIKQFPPTAQRHKLPLVINAQVEASHWQLPGLNV